MPAVGANLKDGKPRYMFRVGKTNIDAAAQLPHGEPTVMGSRPMPGFFFVDGSAASDDELARWLGLALSFVSALPPKPC